MCLRNGAIPALVMALLAITAILPQRSRGGGSTRNEGLHGSQWSVNNKHGRMMVDSIIEHAHIAEKELSLPLGGGGGVPADEGRELELLKRRIPASPQPDQREKRNDMMGWAADISIMYS